MNQLDRQLIHRQMDQLILNTSYRILLDECLHRRMLSEAMIAIIEDRYPDEATKHKKLFEKITRRGPSAFGTLLDICQQNFPNAYALLKNENMPGSAVAVPNRHNNHNNQQEVFKSTYNPNRMRSVSTNLGDSGSSSLGVVQQRLRHLSMGSRSISEDDDTKNNNRLFETTERVGKIKLEVFQDKVEHLYKVEVTTRPQRHRLLEVYPMKGQNRGVIFIMNIITYKNDTHPRRNGAETDKENLVSLFRQLGFTVFYYEDLNMEDYVDLVDQLKHSEYLSTECFAFFVLAHGNHTKGRDKIYLHDNSVLFTEQILEHFNNVGCRRLIRKPKLFFFSICRGDKADYGTLRPAEHTERDGMINVRKDASINMPTYADMFICFSTVPGFAAHRDLHKGSWFVESMCEMWSKHAHDTDVEQLMKLVGRHASTYRTEQNNALQTVASEQRGFFDVLYLNPGYYAD